jgi:hypothetical protein
MGQKAEAIYNTFKSDGPQAAAPDQDQETHDAILKKFDHYFIPMVNVIHERAKFHRRVQQSDENVEAYIRALFEVADLCDFKGLRDEQVRDQLVVGISDKTTSEKLQLEQDLTLEKAIEICRTREQVKSQMASQSGTASLDSMKKSTPGPRNPGPRHKHKKNPGQGPSADKCGNCGMEHSGPDCPARGKKCSACGRKNHFRAVCRQKKKAANEVSGPVQDHDDSLFLGLVSIKETKPWTVSLTISQSQLVFKVDTGADITCLPEADYNTLSPRPKLEPTTVALSSPGGKVQCQGQFIATTTFRQKKYSFPVCVLKHSRSRLLSRNVAVGMGIIKFVEEIRDDVFGDFGLMKGDPVRIRLRPDAQPFNLATPRRISAPLMKPLEDELKRMQDNDIISRVTAPTEWCSPIVVAMKSNGKIRVCVDYKKLNRSVMREQFIMPTVDEISARMAGSTVFSHLDCSMSFWQLPLHPEDRDLTCFITPFGRYVMNRVPFGLNSSTEILQRRLTEVMEGLPGVVIDVDDILVHAATLEQHNRVLDQVLERIAGCGLKLNKKKCKFRVSSVKYLGQVFSAEGMRPDPDKVEAIKNLAPPEDVAGVRRFCGMVNYLGRYTPNLSATLQPINDLMKSDVDFVWDHRQQQAFDA